MVSAVAAMMAAMMVVMAAPAMARDFDRHNNHDNDFDRVVFIDNNPFDNFDDNFFPFFDNNGIEQESQSGDVENNFSVKNTGNFATQCTPAIQFGNTGNFNNAPSLTQVGGTDFFGDNDFRHDGFRDDIFGFDGFRHDGNFFGFDGNNTFLDDFEPGGIDVSFAPEQTTNCSNTIQQSSAASA